LSLEFTKTETAFGSDTAALRDKLADLTKAVGAEIVTKQRTIETLSFVLFGLASCVGIGAAILVSTHIVRALRRLSEGTAAPSKQMTRSGSSRSRLIIWSRKSAPRRK
jgi:hypothetical protein